MKIDVTGSDVLVSDIDMLNAANASPFYDEVCAVIPKVPNLIEIDMSRTRFVDESGLGALFALYKRGTRLNERVVLRILRPRPSIQQLFELTQMHQLYEISRR